MVIADLLPSRSSWQYIVVGLMLSPFSSVAPAAEEDARKDESDVRIFDKDVFEDWGRWEQRPDKTTYYPDGSVFACE